MYLIRDAFGTGWKPFLENSEEWVIRHTDPNDVYEFAPTKVRDHQTLKRYMVFIRIAWSNLPEQYDNDWKNERAFRKAMEHMAGSYDETVVYKDGVRYVIQETKSVSYASMQEDEFKDLFLRVREEVYKILIAAGWGSEDLQNAFGNLA